MKIVIIYSPHAVPNLYGLLSSVQLRYFKELEYTIVWK